MTDVIPILVEIMEVVSIKIQENVPVTLDLLVLLVKNVQKEMKIIQIVIVQ